MPINLDELMNRGATETVVEDNPSEETQATSTETTVVKTEAYTSSQEAPATEEEDLIGSQATDEFPDEETFIGADGQPIAGHNETESEQEVPNVTENHPAAPALKDDFIKKAVDYYNAHGTLQPFLEATQVDYDKVDDQTLIRMKFEKDNPDLSPKVRERLLEKELAKYDLDSIDDEEVEVGKELLRRDANKLRESLKAEQSNFLNSIVAQEEKSQISVQELEAEREQNRLVAQKGIQGVLTNNFIKIGQDADGVNFQISDTNKIAEYAVDPIKFLSTFTTPDQQIDWQKWVKVVAFAENEPLISSELVKRGKALGRKSVIAEMKNTPPLPNANPEIPRGDERNVESPKDDPLYFLQNMKVVGRS